MANIRTLKLNLLADTTDFAAGIRKASGQTDSFSTNLKASMKSVAKSAALASIAVAGVAVAFGVDAVKAAIADQKSQKQLQVALKNTTKATDRQIKSAEKWITKQQFAYGIADDKLRPALARLTRATGDVTKAQDLLSIAIDVSAGTGKDLKTVTDAIAKAQTGNLGSLKKLGVPLTDNIIKTKDLTAANELMAKSYGGAAAANADTLAGKLAIFNQRIGEAKESIGTAILKAIQPMAEKWLPILASALTDVVAGFTGENGKGPAYNLGIAFKNLASAIADVLGIIVGKNDATGKVKTFSESLQNVADSVNAITDAINALKPAFKIFLDINKHLPNLITLIKLVKGANSAVSGVGTGIKNSLTGIGSGLTGARALGGPVLKGGSYLVGEHGPELFTPMGGGTITSNGRLNGGNITIIMNGVIDGESARRSIERVLQQSSVRTGDLRLTGSLI